MLPKRQSLFAAICLLALSGPSSMCADVLRHAGSQAVGSIVGIGGMAGALGALGLLKLTGAILNASGSYATLFFIAGGACLVALAAMHLLVPRLATAKV